MVRAGCPWQMLEKTQMDHSFSSQLSRHHGWMADMLFLEKFSVEWLVDLDKNQKIRCSYRL